MRDYLQLGEKAEITVETSITELTEDKMEMFLRYVVNRLSIGVQTFCERGRQKLGRKGSGEEAAAKIRKAQEMGFSNVGTAMETPCRWERAPEEG